MVIDTHAHLTDAKYKGLLKNMIKNFEDDGLKYVFSVGYDIKSSKKSLKLAKKHENIYAIIGVHPTSINTLNKRAFKWIEKNAKHKKVLAIGEIGLDYHWVKDKHQQVQQKAGFLKQMQLANKLNMPIVIHTRSASNDLVKFLTTNKNLINNGGIVHCFQDDYEFFEKINNLGLIVSVGGAITFKNAKKLAEEVKKLPLNSVVLETDAPYLTPMPYRGRQINQPKYVALVAEKLAEIKGVSLEEVEKQTNKNVYNLFKKLPKQ